MADPAWKRTRIPDRGGREATMARIIEAIDQTAPETKEDLANQVNISEQYLSELLQYLKREGIVTKGYLLNKQALYENIATVSALTPDEGATPLHADRMATLMALLKDLDAVTYDQFVAAKQAFEGGDPDPGADQLEAVSNERHSDFFEELKSYMIAAEWPHNHIAYDLATAATNLEIVGDRSCFIADVIDRHDEEATGVIADRVRDIFNAGAEINGLMGQIAFAADLEMHERLQEREETVHRDLNELFELVTAYSPQLFGYLASIVRALERTIFYWVHTAELAFRLHSTLKPEHISV
ncbi:MAG: helix-turn-helix domain-containing protein [Salinarchaeum sp.]